MRRNSAIVSLRGSTGWITDAAESKPLGTVIVGQGWSKPGLTRSKYLSDCSPGRRRSASRPIA